MYLTELPLLLMLMVTIYYNNMAEGFIKFYPLMVSLVLGMVFIFIYLFRLVSISVEEIKSIGPFSSRDRAVINEGKTLILTLCPGKRLHVDLFGNDGLAPMLDWAQNDEHEIIDIYLFRGKAVGGKGTAARVLRFFDVPDDEALRAVSEDGFEKEYESVTVTTEVRDDITEILIKFTETI